MEKWKWSDGLSHQESEVFHIFQSNARTLCYAEQWIFCHMEGNVDFVAQALVEAAKQCTTTCEINTIFTMSA